MFDRWGAAIPRQTLCDWGRRLPAGDHLLENQGGLLRGGNMTSITEIWERTGFDFFWLLEDDFEAAFEAAVAEALW
jgi:hypothetical protein